MNNIKSGLASAGAEAMGTIQFVVNVVAVPLICAVVLFFLLYEIGCAAKKHTRGEEYQDDIIKMVVCVIVLALVSSFPLWGWQMIGVSGGTATASIFLYTLTGM